MIFQLEHEPFQSLCQWHIWRLGLDFAGLPSKFPEDVNQTGLVSLHVFYQDLLVDMYENPEAYGLPLVAYEAYVENRMRLENDKKKGKSIRADRMKVRVAIENGICDFLFQIGQAGEPVGNGLVLDRSFFDTLIDEKVKKTKNKAFPDKFERLGFVFKVGETVEVSNSQYQGMLGALSRLAKACALNEEYGFYFFRRCDLAVLEHKNLPAFEDAFRLVSVELRDEVKRNDDLFNELRFKREIFVADAAGGYRLRYSKKSDSIVYWCRLMSWYSPDFHHNLRWKFTSELTPLLFSRLEEIKPELADRIFKGIKPCEHDYENCMARVMIERKGVFRECCSEAGWDTIGESPDNFSDLRLVCTILDELLREFK